MKLWRKQFAALLSVQFLVSTAHGMFVPLLPAFLATVGGIGKREIIVWSGLIFASNFVAMMTVSPILGKFGDRFGRKPVMLWSGFGMTIITALMAVAQHPLDLLLLRFAQGCFTGILPFAMVLLVIGAPKERVGVSIGTMQMMGEAGSVVGPLLGSLMLGLWPARHLFPWMSAFILLGTCMVLKQVREPQRAAASEAPQNIRADMKEVWGTRPFPQLLLSAFCINFALVGTSPMIAYQVEQSVHRFWTETFSAGIALSVTSAAVIVFSSMLGRAADRWGPLPLLKLATAGAALLGVVQMWTHTYAAVLICRFLLGLCVAAMMPNIQAQIRQYMKPGKESRTFGIANSWMFLGSLSGPLLGGVITAQFGVAGWFAAAALAFGISYLQALGIGRYVRQRVRLNFEAAA